MAESKSKKELSEDAIEKKLSKFSSTQDSVQAMSLWIMQHKSHHQKIVDTWLKVLKNSETKHKLTLFYLCNDVVQHAKKKKALYYLENFKGHLREAVQTVREYDSIKPNIGRIFKIWDERKTYDSKFVTELKNILEGGSVSKSSSTTGTPSSISPVEYKPSSKDKKHKHHHKEKSSKQRTIERSKSEKESDKIIAEAIEATPEISGEFKPSKFLAQMSTLKNVEGEVTLKAKQLAALRIDATNIEAVKQLKDRSHGNEFCRQFEESCVKIEDYVAMLEKEIKQRSIVLAICDEAENFYCTQFDEATLVAYAYKNFGARVNNMKKRVDDMKKIIPATPSPVPSPSADAPSPGNSPPLLNMDDNETVDMDLCEDHPEHSKTDHVNPGRAYTAMVKSIAEPIASLTNIVMMQTEQSSKQETVNVEKEFKGSDILESRIATMLPNLAKGNSTLGGLVGGIDASQPPDIYADTPTPAVKVPEVYTPPPRPEPPAPPAPAPVEPPQSQPVEDTGSSTPVMDEPDDKEPSPPPKPIPEKKPPETKTKTNPIDFLSQLLTKTSSSSSSSNFLQTLSLLTNTVKTQYQKQERDTNDASKTEDDAKPPSPTYTPRPTPSVATEFTGVPPPSAANSQAGSWTGWKQINSAQPDPSSPPIISQTKPTELPHQPLPPPLPQMPPPPTEPLNPSPYGVQPPSPQDFSLPPPSLRQVVSQSFMNPPPPPSISPSFLPVSSSQTFTSQPIVLSTSVPPSSIHSGVGRGFNPGVPYGLAPPGADHDLTRPPPPVSNPKQLGAGFMPRDNTWQAPRPPGPPPASEAVQFNQFAAPPPPDTRLPPPSWQTDTPGENIPTNNSNGFNQITSVPSQRADWNRSSSFEDQSWEPTNENQGSGYHHPWDEPGGFEEDDDDTEFADEILDATLPPAPKSILRNNRKSSLREVTLVDESSSMNTSSVTDSVVSTPAKFSGVKPQGNEQRPASILKKTVPEIPETVNDRTQSEFINILKQKSGGASNLPDPPPMIRNVSEMSSVPDGHGEPINTIGVVGNSGQPSSAKSDDMELDNEDVQHERSEIDFSADNWTPRERWDNDDFIPQRKMHEPEMRDFDNHRPHWSDHRERPWHQRRPIHDHDNFHSPRGGFLPPRPRFPDSYRGPSPAKRPFLPPRPRHPYYRY
ncbi:Regulation of nuclear pre-mRNA domain-containing protein 2 [Mactra antiquata]